MINIIKIELIVQIKINMINIIKIELIVQIKINMIVQIKIEMIVQIKHQHFYKKIKVNRIIINLHKVIKKMIQMDLKIILNKKIMTAINIRIMIAIKV